MKKYSKIITSIAALGLSVAVFGVGAFALFSASKEDTQTATTGSVSISLKEDDVFTQLSAEKEALEQSFNSIK